MAKSIEIEAKFAVAELGGVRERLRTAGGTYVGRVVECNRFFDRADSSLRAAGCGLRVRSVRVLDGPAVAATVTFKGPLQAGAFKTRRELEVGVSDAEVGAELLTALGFAETLSFEKVRESWRVGPCEVELDELPYIGTFVEIEGASDEAIRIVQQQLGLGGLSSERASYLALLLRHSERAGIAATSLRLEDGAIAAEHRSS